ncbi:MAG: poly(A) polymerase [Methylophagaceae bacterium]|jgi:poly(A) polymerase
MLFLNKIFKRLNRSSEDKADKAIQEPTPLIVSRDEHSLSRSQVSPQALKVLYGLKDAGYEAYLVGGCVRDLLLGHEPKDFDVATDASPEQVHKIFRKSRLIGRRFKLVHVGFGRDVIEVATFRAPPQAQQHIDQQGRIVQDNVFGTLEQDAWRRDFTVNALYYNIRDFSIVDYTGGISDLQAGKIRLIGDVETRYREDPVRILRALRFVGKLGLELDHETEAHIASMAKLLRDIPPARLFDETLKLYLSGKALVTHQLLVKYGIFAHLFPSSAQLIAAEPDSISARLLTKALENTDKRIQEAKPVTPAFLFAAILWGPASLRWQYYQDKKIPKIPALQKAATEVIIEQVQRVAVPKRFTLVTRDIWSLQIRLNMRQGKRAIRLLTHPKFRAGYDFLLLRTDAGEPYEELAQWWTDFQEVDESEQQKMINALAPEPTKKKRRRRRKPATKKVTVAPVNDET